MQRAEDVVGVVTFCPVERAAFFGALDAAGDYLLDVNVVGCWCVAVRVAVDVEGYGCIGEGFAEEPAHSLLVWLLVGVSGVVDSRCVLHCIVLCTGMGHVVVRYGVVLGYWGDRGGCASGLYNSSYLVLWGVGCDWGLGVHTRARMGSVGLDSFASCYTGCKY